MPKYIHLKGGLGNQLWILAYAFRLLSTHGTIFIDLSWYSKKSKLFYSANRKLRFPHVDLIKLISGQFIFSNSLYVLSKERISELVLRSIASDALVDKFVYRQDVKFITDAYLYSLLNALEIYASSIVKNIDLSSMVALHLRLGDRGSDLNCHEIEALKSTLYNVSAHENIMVFTDDRSNALKYLSPLRHPRYFTFSDFSDPVLDLVAMSMCRNIFSIRQSTYVYWANQLKTARNKLTLDFS